VTLTFDGREMPERGAEVHAADRPVGVVTSAVVTPGYGPLALAVVSTECAAVGARVSVGERPATVRSLPIYDPDKRRPRA